MSYKRHDIYKNNDSLKKSNMVILPKDNGSSVLIVNKTDCDKKVQAILD